MLDYTMPVAALLTLGEPNYGTEWFSYPLQFGLTTADIPELVRMVQDERLNQADSDSTEVFAPLHAWRTLGQLNAVEAIPALLKTLQRIDDEEDDWVADDMPQVLELIGPAAVPALTEYLKKDRHGPQARSAAAEALCNIGKNYPAARTDCVAALSATLEKFVENHETLNGFLVNFLGQLKAIETAPLVEQAFAADKVDSLVMTDWEDWQVEAGLLAERLTPEDSWEPGDMFGSVPLDVSRSKEDNKTKNKRKQAAKSRKKNRKKK